MQSSVPSSFLPRPDSSLAHSLGPHLPTPAPPPLRRSEVSCPTEAGLGVGGGGLAFPGRRVTGSGALGQSADRQAPDAISGGARLSSQFPFFPPSETRNAEPVHVTSPQPQAGVLGAQEGQGC